LGYPISLALNLLARIFQPFMVYGYWNAPTRSFRRLTRVSSTAVLVDKSKIDLGDGVWVWHHSIIDGSNGVRVGDGVQIGAWVGIFSHSSHVAIRLHGRDYINVDKHSRLGYVRAPVEIGEFSFIGAGACVLPGVTIGRGCLVAAGAVVSRDVPDFAIVAGNPAKVIGSTIDLDRRYFDDPVVQESYFDRGVIAKHESQINAQESAASTAAKGEPSP